MAGETVVTTDAKNKRSYVIDQDPRVVHLEGRVERVEGDVRDIKAGVNKLLERPQNPGFSQVLAGVLTTLLITGLIFGFGEWRLGQAVMPVKDEVAAVAFRAGQVAKDLQQAEVRAAIMAERMEWIREMKARQLP